MSDRKLKIAVICSSNQNRSMEAHNFLRYIWIEGIRHHFWQGHATGTAHSLSHCRHYKYRTFDKYNCLYTYVSVWIVPALSGNHEFFVTILMNIGAEEYSIGTDCASIKSVHLKNSEF